MKEINEMCRFSPSETGLNDIYIWIGKQKTNHYHRVKISNKNNKFDVNDCFVITIPKFEIIGDVDLDKRKLDIIKDFLSKNINEIEDYLNDKITFSDLSNHFKNNRNNMNNNIKKFYEFNGYNQLNDLNKLSDSDYDYLCPLEYSETGLKDVVIWIGNNPENNINLVKVSNIPNDKSGYNTFIINLDNMNIIGNNDNEFIKNNIKDIMFFLYKNKDIIIDYSNSDTMSTSEMVENFIK